ncbi:MAG: hypothetical protein IPH84_00690 [Bacteroidales bacterium]|nr:hypothetical protein [Bacteroidales bacterium]
MLHWTIRRAQVSDLKLVPTSSVSRFPVCSVIDYDHNDYLVATYGKGFWLMNKRTYSFKPHQVINAAIKTEFSYGCKRLSDGRILLQTNISPFIFDQKSQQIIYFNQAYVRSDNVFSAYEDQSGHLWLGTGLGLKIFDRNLKLVHSYFSNTDEENTICSNVILDIKPGQWVNLLSCYHGSRPVFLRYYHQDLQLYTTGNLTSKCVWNTLP